MSNMPVSEIENTRRREDILRELNMYPLWQRRTASEGIALEAEATVASAATAVIQTAQTPASHPVEAGTLDWAALKKAVKNCTACSLRAGCLQTVFGTGDETADWLFIGSWPTEDDENSGLPFSGAAGQLLDNMLAAIQLKRDSKVYLTNVVKCSGSITRGPQAQQIVRCAPYLARQIQLLKPKVIVVLGHSTATAMLGEDREWSSMLGKLHHYQTTSENGMQTTIPLIITHHPVALLLTPLNKAQAWRDLCLARDTMLQLA